jgi:hypothetical protein
MSCWTRQFGSSLQRSRASAGTDCCMLPTMRLLISSSAARYRSRLPAMKNASGLSRSTWNARSSICSIIAPVDTGPSNTSLLRSAKQPKKLLTKAREILPCFELTPTSKILDLGGKDKVETETMEMPERGALAQSARGGFLHRRNVAPTELDRRARVRSLDR